MKISFILLFKNVDGYIEESNGIKYLAVASTDENKETLKSTQLWNETKYQIKTINGREIIKYRNDFMKIRFELDNNLPWIKC